MFGFEYINSLIDKTLASQAPEQLRARAFRHLNLFFDDRLDPRAWKGVYRVIGEDIGRRIKDIFKTELRVCS